MFDRVLNAPLVFYGTAILRITFVVVVCVSTVKRVLHNFTKYFPGTRVNQIVNKCLNG